MIQTGSFLNVQKDKNFSMSCTLNRYFYKELIHEDVQKFMKDIKSNLTLVLISFFVGSRLNHCYYGLITRLVYVFVSKEK